MLGKGTPLLPSKPQNVPNPKVFPQKSHLLSCFSRVPNGVCWSFSPCCSFQCQLQREGGLGFQKSFSQNDLKRWFCSACQPHYRQKLFPAEWFGSLIRLTAIAFPRLWQFCGKGFAGAGVVIVLVVHAWERNSTSTLKAPKCPKPKSFPTKVPFVELLFQSPHPNPHQNAKHGAKRDKRNKVYLDAQSIY